MTTVDPNRLRRALSLTVEPLDDGFRVSGGAEPHTIRGRRCTCADAMYRRPIACKHVLAIHVHRRLDPRVRAALRELVR
jgi:hypothetical protein